MEAYGKGIEYEGNGGSEAMKKGYKTAKEKVEEEEKEAGGEGVEEVAANRGAPGGAAAGGGGGMPDLAGLASMFGGGRGGGGGGKFPTFVTCRRDESTDFRCRRRRYARLERADEQSHVCRHGTEFDEQSGSFAGSRPPSPASPAPFLISLILDTY